jgi:hypothetical protein
MKHFGTSDGRQPELQERRYSLPGVSDAELDALIELYESSALSGDLEYRQTARALRELRMRRALS